ncbi:MAG: L,D-transpeptidase family protein [Xanthobacteraceae bacterium]|nr:L,D-transpeptidase family protein [Xanthobacteraceae bacterium]
MAGVAIAGSLGAADPASADIVIAIDKSIQRMAVVVDGKEQHVWKVSTGTLGGPRSGTYRPQRLEKSWFSRKYGMSPMPHAIFFDEGYAIHGTIYVSRLGNRASHGCVRLHPSNAATLFSLVRSRGMAGTTIVVSNAGWPAAAKKQPDPEAPVKASLPVANPPKLATPGTVAPPLAPAKPERVLLERIVETAPGSTGTVLVQPVEPPQPASSSSMPATPSVVPKAPAENFLE